MPNVYPTGNCSACSYGPCIMETPCKSTAPTPNRSAVEFAKNILEKELAGAENEKATSVANAELIAERDNLKALMKRREDFIMGLLWTAAEKSEVVEKERAQLREALQEVMRYYPTSQDAFPAYAILAGLGR